MAISIQTYILASYLTSAISLLSSLYLFWKILHLHKVHYSIKIIQQIAAADAAQSAFLMIMPAIEYANTHCAPQEFVLIATNWASLFWSAALAVFSYKAIANADFIAKNFYQYCLVIIYPLAALVAALPIFETSLVSYSAIKNKSICTVVPNPDFSPFARFVIVFLFEALAVIIALLLSIVCYIMQVRVLKNDYPPEVIKAMNVRIENLAWYPLSQVVIYAPHSFIVCYQQYTGIESDWVIFAGFCLYRLGGLINTIVFLYVRNIQEKNERARSEDGYGGKNLSLIGSKRYESSGSQSNSEQYSDA